MNATVPFTDGELLCAWHDIECGDYRADLALWRELATQAAGPVLDVGAGTGRVAIDLARQGHDVLALDLEPVLLDELERRARDEGVRVRTLVADAARFELDRPAGVILVPMQTLQLLDAPLRAGFFASARAAVMPGGIVAIAIATALEPFAPSAGDLPAPDVGERDGWRFVSQPTAIANEGSHARIDRVRRLIAPDGATVSGDLDTTRLAVLDEETLEAEAAAAGFEPLERREIPETLDHVASEVVLLRG